MFRVPVNTMMSYKTKKGPLQTALQRLAFIRYSLGKEEIMRTFPYYCQTDNADIDEMLLQSWNRLTAAEKEAFQIPDTGVNEDIELSKPQQAMMDDPLNGAVQYAEHMMKLLQQDPKFITEWWTFDYIYSSWDELIPESKKIYMAQQRRILLKRFKNELEKETSILSESCQDDAVQASPRRLSLCSPKNFSPSSGYVKRVKTEKESPELILKRDTELPECVLSVKTSEKVVLKNAKPKKAPTAFACFVHDKRSTLMNDPEFVAANPKEQIYHLKQIWKFLDDDSKLIYEEKEKRARARAEKKHPNRI